jgi:hypothetical protein
MATPRLVVLLVLAAAALAGCSDEPAEIDGSGYTFALPDGWEDGADEISNLEDETGVLADSVAFGEREDDFTTNVNVIRQGGVPPGMTARQYARICIAQLRNPAAAGAPQDLIAMLENAAPSDIDGPRPTELGGEDAATWQYDSKQGGGTTRVRQLAAVKDGAAYTVTVTALPQTFDDGAAALDEIVESWEWE